MSNVIPGVEPSERDFINKGFTSWSQPDRKDICVSDDTALMSLKDYKLLLEYSSTIPTGAYPGKMWRCVDRDHLNDGQVFQEYLCWYGYVDGDTCSINSRKLIIMDWKATVGI
jgi:hypothetical protein